MNEKDVLNWLASEGERLGMAITANSYGTFIVTKLGSPAPFGYGNTVEKAVESLRQRTEEQKANLRMELEKL